MLKVIALQGIHKEDRDKWARNFIKDKSSEWVIICKDDIRNMLGKFWVAEREVLVLTLEYDSIASALEMGFNVIINHNNLNKGTIRKIEQLENLLRKPIDLDIKFKKIC